LELGGLSPPRRKFLAPLLPQILQTENPNLPNPKLTQNPKLYPKPQNPKDLVLVHA
jgi:hypothetical protein